MMRCSRYSACTPSDGRVPRRSCVGIRKRSYSLCGSFRKAACTGPPAYTWFRCPGRRHLPAGSIGRSFPSRSRSRRSSRRPSAHTHYCNRSGRGCSSPPRSSPVRPGRAHSDCPAGGYKRRPGRFPRCTRRRRPAPGRECRTEKTIMARQMVRDLSRAGLRVSPVSEERFPVFHLNVRRPPRQPLEERDRGHSQPFLLGPPHSLDR